MFAADMKEMKNKRDQGLGRGYRRAICTLHSHQQTRRDLRCVRARFAFDCRQIRRLRPQNTRERFSRQNIQRCNGLRHARARVAGRDAKDLQTTCYDFISNNRAAVGANVDWKAKNENANNHFLRFLI